MGNLNEYLNKKLSIKKSRKLHNIYRMYEAHRKKSQTTENKCLCIDLHMYTIDKRKVVTLVYCFFKL